uniref:Putative glycosyltransferase n=1 Tax=viral metagenome TaxID=1070528 RepID=A0A6M3LWJ8_9ZZZZ
MNHPLALIIYNRPDHLRRVLEALAPQEPEPLYIFSDGPRPGETVDTARAQIGKALEWTAPILCWRETNLGLGASVVAAVDHVLARHDTVIVLEDDCEPGPHFMAWMNNCLDLYRHDPHILSISGYTVNIPEHLRHDRDAYMMPRIETWGWATWRDKWVLYERDKEVALSRAEALEIPLDRGGPDVPAMLRGSSQSWSPGWMLACYLNDMFCVYPMVSHVQNIGMDGSGVNCGTSERWVTAIAEQEPEKYPVTVQEWMEPIGDYVRAYHAHY